MSEGQKYIIAVRQNLGHDYKSDVEAFIASIVL